MATSINSNSNPTFVNLSDMHGSGQSSQFVNEVTGILLGIQVREGYYEVTDRKTGQVIQRPNSWTSYWQVQNEDGSQRQVMMSWPTYLDQNGNVCPWSRYDASIDLAACAANGTILHFEKDSRNFYHLSVVEVHKAKPMPIMGQQQPQVQQPAGIPWRQN